MSINLHIACGKNLLPGWVNIDICRPCDIQLDITQLNWPIQLSNMLNSKNQNSIKYIFTEHFIEHLTLAQGRIFLNQCYQLLEPNGVLRLSTPDLYFLVTQYYQKNITTWENVNWSPKTPCQMINEGLRNWGHKFVYDFDELINLLVESKFKSINKVLWQKSNYVKLNNLEIRPYNNEIIIEAIKII